MKIKKIIALGMIVIFCLGAEMKNELTKEGLKQYLDDIKSAKGLDDKNLENKLYRVAMHYHAKKDNEKFMYYINQHAKRQQMLDKELKEADREGNFLDLPGEYLDILVLFLEKTGSPERLEQEYPELYSLFYPFVTFKSNGKGYIVYSDGRMAQWYYSLAVWNEGANNVKTVSSLTDKYMIPPPLDIFHRDIDNDSFPEVIVRYRKFDEVRDPKSDFVLSFTEVDMFHILKIVDDKLVLYKYDADLNSYPSPGLTNKPTPPGQEKKQ